MDEAPAAVNARPGASGSAATKRPGGGNGEAGAGAAGRREETKGVQPPGGVLVQPRFKYG